MISVIMPVYNDSQNIAHSIKETYMFLQSYGTEYELIIVNDGSTDNTYINALSVALEHETISVIGYERNMGKGYALKQGFQRARGDIVVFFDSGLDLPPRQLAEFIDSMRENHTDIAIGSKRHRLSKVHISLKRKLLSTGYSLILRALFNLNLRDTQVGLKIFRRHILQQIIPKILVKRYAYDIEILAIAQKLGYSIAELPVELNQNLTSKIDFKAVWYIFVDTIAVFYRMKVLHYYDHEGEDAQYCDQSRTKR